MASFLLYGALILLAAAYYLFSNYKKKKFDYFKEKGIPYIEPELYYGNVRDQIQKKKCAGEMYRELYFKFKKMGVKHGGIYGGTGRSWMPVDPDLIKTVLTKDFIHFSAHNRKLSGLFFNNLFHMDGEEWKDMRRKLTPTFTSGKMKMMFDIILQKTYGLYDIVDEMGKRGEPAEIKEALVKFTVDVIGNCGYGIECNSLQDPNAEFFQHVKNLIKKRKQPPLMERILIYLGLAKAEEVPNFEDFFREVVRDTLKYREENKVIRKDFLHLMIQLKNKGAVTELNNDSEDVFNKTVKEEVMSLEDIAGQCLMFFAAGFDTSSTAMSYAVLELTQNQDVQKKLRQEVREVLKRHNGKLTYEAVQEMTYCDNVIHETLRKYPALPYLLRLCTKTYKVPGTNNVIEKGTSANIPVWGLHMDPDYFPDPEKFIPERHNAENKGKIKEFTYLPFGEGPRMCLGLRFGLMQSKAGLATLVKDYNFTLNQKTPYPPVLVKSSFTPAVKGGIWVDVVKAD